VWVAGVLRRGVEVLGGELCEEEEEGLWIGWEEVVEEGGGMLEMGL